MGETKVIYHLDEQETPYLVKLPLPAERVTLADFKAVLNKPSYKFFFKSMDDDFGVVKEEISDDNAKLPCFNGRVVCWLVSAEGSHSEVGSVCADNQSDLPPPIERTGGIGDSRPPSFHPNTGGSQENLDNETETDSVVSAQREILHRKERPEHAPRVNGITKLERKRDIGVYESSSTLLSSELETTSFFDSDEDDSTSRFSSSTEQSSASRLMRRHKRRRRKPKAPRIERVNDINFENMSNDDAVRVLREIVHKPGPITLTVAKCWDPNPRGCFTLPRSEPIRPIDPAAWVSHTAAMTGTYPAYGMSPSMSTITSTSSSITSSIPETERFDDFHLSIHSDMATIVKAMSSPESGLEVRDRMWLKITIPNAFIGSDVVDWLYHHVEGFADRREARKFASNLLKAGYIRHTVNKITFSEQCYYIFGDLCGSMCQWPADMASLSLNDHDGSSGASDQDTLAPLPHPGAAPWPMAFPYQYPPPHPYTAHPGFPDPGYNYGGGSAGSQPSEGSRSSGSNRSGSERRKEKDVKPGDSKSGGSGSESDHTTRNSLRRDRTASEHSHRSHRSHHSTAHSVRSHHTHQSYGPPGVPPPYSSAMMMMPTQPSALGPPGAPPGRDLASVPPELTASRQSFRMAMGNPTKNYGVFDFL
ncbi:segment polarity protein dishevelled homolog DVL-3 isoform X4 [Rhinatrema bivittatum]|uniref:segment polarity protein dishevelled homolog DVL-3 isoform X4 n=1 Tax=Rhinatrema bivittatum TaxID=194408 RepID=UPI001126B1BD|nr:segment polarity protein dishevelled homolog DVL-3 isoform X4 [Rhinatrema bivittatum]